MENSQVLGRGTGKCPFVLASLGMALFAALVAWSDIVYVKPTACGSGDGSNWANAMGSVSNALFQALATPAPREVRMAKGVHTWLSGVAVGRDVKGVYHPDVSGGYAFSIRGGYAGVSEDETPDNEANPTYLSFDANGDDRWVKRKYSELAANGSSTAVDCGPVIDGGVVIVPDDSEDDDALYTLDSGKISDNTIFIDLQDNGSVVEFSDFTFLGAGGAKPYRSGQAAFIGQTGAGGATFKNVTFLGSYFCKGSGIANLGKPQNATIVDNVKILWSYCTQTALGLGGCSGSTFNKMVVRGFFFNGTAQAGAVIRGNPVTSVTFKDCEFEKCFANLNHGGYVGPAVVFGTEKSTGSKFENCVFRRICGRGNNVPAVINFRTKAANGVHDNRVVNCLFENCTAYTSVNNAPNHNLGLVAMGADRNSLEGCTFKDNAIVVKPTGTSTIAYAAPVTVTTKLDAANPGEGRRAIVNCTFSGNTVTVASGGNDASKTTQCFSRSVLVNSIYSGCELDVVIANCTFADRATALPDVVWTGLDTTYPVQVVNSYFCGDAANGYVPFALDAANMITADNCLMNGCDALPGGVLGSGNVFTDLPVGAWESVDGLVTKVIRPAARVPALRTALPLGAFTSAAGGLYLTDAADGNAHLYQSDTGIAVPAEVARLADAEGVARPDDGSTIGAVQALTAKAENGATLFVDVSPKGTGTLSGGGAVQVVEKGDGIVTVTATSSDPSKYVFEGWVRPDGTVYSASASLEISNLDDDLQLTAKFSAPKVKYVFDLGIAGTFDETGTARVELELEAGAKLVVPTFTIDTEKVQPLGWDRNPPETVGSANDTFTYTYLEKVFRVIRVDTAATVGGDGSSWANAMTNIQAAIEAAGAWKGEVWVKQGVHPIAKSLTMKKNVAILGGFEGTDGKYEGADAERVARDPKKYLSVITGDTGLDDVWFDGLANARMKDADGNDFTVVKDGLYREPAFVPGPGQWYGHTTVGTNVSRVFDNAEADLDGTAVLDGVLVTGAFGIYNGNTAVPTVSRCKFVGCACVRNTGSTEMIGCAFVAVRPTLNTDAVLALTTGLTGIRSTVRDCAFRYCYTEGDGIVKYSSQDNSDTGIKAQLLMQDCLFEYCRCQKSLNVYAQGVALQSEFGAETLIGCTFRGMYSTSGLGAIALTGQGAVVSNCLFEANASAFTGSSSIAAQYMSATVFCRGSSRFYNCAFRDNGLSRTAVNEDDSTEAAVIRQSGNLLLANCTFDGNAVTSVSENGTKAVAAIVRAPGSVTGITDNDNVGNLGVVGCTFNNNTAVDGDIYFAGNAAATPCRLVNTILWGGEGHVAVSASGTGNPELYAWNSIVQDFDSNAAYVADAQEVRALSPHVAGKWRGEAPVMAKNVRSGSSATRGGRSIYVDGDGVLCIPADGAETSFVNAATGAAVTPAEPKVMLPDAFGEERPAGNITIGVLQKIVGGMAIAVR